MYTPNLLAYGLLFAEHRMLAKVKAKMAVQQ